MWNALNLKRLVVIPNLFSLSPIFFGQITKKCLLLEIQRILSVTLLDDPGYKYKKYKSLPYSQLEIILKEIIDEINNGNFSHLQELADTIDGLENLSYLKKKIKAGIQDPILEFFKQQPNLSIRQSYDRWAIISKEWEDLNWHNYMLEYNPMNKEICTVRY